MKTCNGCDTQRPDEMFANANADGAGRTYKTCRTCRSKKAVRNAKRRRPKSAADAEQCADCDRKLTPNRTILIDGESLCMACRARRFGR